MLNFLLAATNLFADPMLLAALALAIGITSLSYMAGEFFSMPSIRAFAKGETRELAVTGVIVLLSIILLMPGGPFDMAGRGFAPQPPAGQTGLCEEWLQRHPEQNDALTGQTLYENGSYVFGRAGHFLGCSVDALEFFSGFADKTLGSLYDPEPAQKRGVILPMLMRSYGGLMFLEIVTGFVSTFATSITLPIGAYPPFTLNLEIGNLYFGGFLAPVNEANTVLVDMVGVLMSATIGQKMLLDFFEANVPMVILPLGLLMRAFPFTRKTGSTVVAFCFAAYFVFPTSVLINQRIYDIVQNPACPAGAKPAGAACTAGAECCSGTCRAGKCSAYFTDFSEYASSYAICQDTDLKNKLAIVTASLQQKEKEMIDEMQKEQEAALKNNAASGKTEDRMRNFVNAQQEIARLREDAMKNNAGLTFATPSAAWGIVGMFESATSDVAKMAMLVSLFIVNEIIFTLTLFKDFSLLIGGEARLFGMSRLV